VGADELVDFDAPFELAPWELDPFAPLAPFEPVAPFALASFADPFGVVGALSPAAFAVFGFAEE
jgi:hypothetical protein